MKADLKDIKVRFQGGQWEMKKSGGGWEGPPYPKLEVAEDDVGVLTYDIVGSNEVNFHPVDPFIQKPGANPKKSDFNDQFIVLGKGTRELTVIDVNGLKDGQNYQGDSYEYMLQFSNGSELDPIITNMGCCKLYSQAEAVAYVIAFAAVCAMAFMGYRLWRAKG